jgi:hypothetical protein
MLHTRLEPSGVTPFRILGALALLGERGWELGEVDFSEATTWTADGRVLEELRAVLEVLSDWQIPRDSEKRFQSEGRSLNRGIGAIVGALPEMVTRPAHAPPQVGWSLQLQ